jgi:hypothetical protein
LGLRQESRRLPRPRYRSTWAIISRPLGAQIGEIHHGRAPTGRPIPAKGVSPGTDSTATPTPRPRRFPALPCRANDGRPCRQLRRQTRIPAQSLSLPAKPQRGVPIPAKGVSPGSSSAAATFPRFAMSCERRSACQLRAQTRIPAQSLSPPAEPQRGVPIPAKGVSPGTDSTPTPPAATFHHSPCRANDGLPPAAAPDPHPFPIVISPGGAPTGRPYTSKGRKPWHGLRCQPGSPDRDASPLAVSCERRSACQLRRQTRIPAQ